MQLRYGRGVLGGASHAATALLVYELMGPTYPGKYDPDTGFYHLNYPGLLFLFPIPPQHAQHCLSHATEQHLEFPDNTTPVASRICIHAGAAGGACTLHDGPRYILVLSQPSAYDAASRLHFNFGRSLPYSQEIRQFLNCNSVGRVVLEA